MKKTSIEWIKKTHPIWGESGEGEGVHRLSLSLTFPKVQWVSLDGRFSIIEPSSISFGQYELFDGKDIYRFATLGEAQNFALTL